MHGMRAMRARGARAMHGKEPWGHVHVGRQRCAGEAVWGRIRRPRVGRPSAVRRPRQGQQGRDLRGRGDLQPRVVQRAARRG